MGALLASALIIVPAATAPQLTSRLSHFVLLAAASLVSVTTGFLLNIFACKFSTAGPTIAILSAMLFGLSLLRKTI